MSFNAITDYWLKHYVHNEACSLCGNSGIIHTEGLRTPAGKYVGKANYCICPNGKKAREYKILK